jgi:hypothetical protein
MYSVQKSDGSFPLIGQLTITPLTYASLWALALGMVLNVVAYSSFQVVPVGLFFLLSIMLLLRLKFIGGREERRAYLLVYSITWFWAGIAAIYANYLSDPIQLKSDASLFYEFSSSDYFSKFSLREGMKYYEGILVIKLWGFLYNFFALLGFDRGRYIGITLNVTFVALTAVVSIKMMKKLFGQDGARLRLFTFAFAFCGIFWLFGAIHNRDAAVMLAITLLAYYWVRFLADLSFRNIIMLVVATIIATSIFVFLRNEFLFVPPAMIIAAFAAVIFGKNKGISLTKKILSILLLLISVYFFITVLSDVSDSLLINNEYYSELSIKESSANSLGTSVIVNQPLPLRLVFGFVYMFVFPIPFWVGFQLESVYYLFKSFHVVFMYALTPLFALTIIRVLKSKTYRNPSILFLLFSFIGFTFSAAASSLETRHVGAFIPLLLVSSMVPDLTYKIEKRNYHILLTFFLSVMFLIHIAWAFIKLT